MPRLLSNALTPLTVKNAKPGRHADGGGLQLLVKESGARSWVYRFMLKGKSRDVGLGTAGPGGVSLSAARDARDALRAKVKSGVDPLLERQQDASQALAAAQTAQIAGMSFKAAAEAYIGANELMDYVSHLEAVTAKAEGGDLAIASRLLASQAVTLDSMFTELARRAALNMGEYIEAAERYGRLALKAQANSRATLETLAKLHQPREQTVKHVHVNEGGQAVVADHFHQHRGDGENGKTRKQSDATGPAGPSAALPSPDTSGNKVPVPSRKRKTAMPNARRDQSRSA